jgi:hypothetical protein
MLVTVIRQSPTTWAAWSAGFLRLEPHIQPLCTPQQEVQALGMGASSSGCAGMLHWGWGWRPCRHAAWSVNQFTGLATEQAEAGSAPPAGGAGDCSPRLQDPPAAESSSPSAGPPTLPSFEQLCAAERRRLGGRGDQALGPAERAALDRLLKRLRTDGPVREAARRLHVSAEVRGSHSRPAAWPGLYELLGRAVLPCLHCHRCISSSRDGPSYAFGMCHESTRPLRHGFTA